MITATLEPERKVCPQGDIAERLEIEPEAVTPATVDAETRLFYVVTTLAGGVMFLLAAFAIFLMVQTLLLR